MKKSLLVLLIALPLASTLSGCVISVNDGEIDHSLMGDSEDRTYENRKKIAKIQLGSSFADMQEKLGVADFSQTYSINEQTVRVLFYRTQRKHKDGLTTKDECTYLEFIDGELSQTGNGGEYSQITKQ
ncbi:MAG: hypothetical protein ACJAXJ_002744 [Colwellia sp.]|jgi:hypothetical protein|tara:strand:+ start:3585 stop:3968 length:384 start_codon:yes stop_codon:yes gene_type:complete